MNNITKLVIAVFLGGGAAVTNMAWLQSVKTPPMYVGASTDLSGGDLITDETLIPVPVPGDPARMGQSFIPYSQRSVLYGSKAQHSYRTGDLFTYSDIRLHAGEKSEYEILGPFRIVGVGGAFKEKSISEQRIGGGGNNVTLAVGYETDEKTHRLLEVLRTGTRIIGVQVIPSGETELTERSLKDTEYENYVHQTISLAGVENIPAVLYDGEVIRFVLPPKSSGY